MKIVSWHHALTDHQSHTLLEFQRLLSEPIKVVIGAHEILARQKQGWTVPDWGGLQVEVLPHKSWWKRGRSILRESEAAIHIFNGPFGDWRFLPLMLAAGAANLKMCMVSEPYSEIPVGYLTDESALAGRLKSYLRPALYRVYGRLLAKQTSGVFAISSKAAQQYLAMGFMKDRIFPYGYFVPDAGGHKLPTAPTPGARPLRLVFVGSLIARKDVGTLLDAVRIVAEAGGNIELDVYGPGDASQYGSRLSCIRFCGPIAFGRAQSVIQAYDCLVLPSLYDGWGVVVNEALMAGVPVICSNQVGAGAMVQSWKCGQTFTAGNTEALAGVFLKVIEQSLILHDWSISTEAVRQLLVPSVAARYMMDCLRYISDPALAIPVCPWYSVDSESANV